MKIHHSKYKYAAALDAVEDAVWKTMRETTANVVFDDWPSRRMSKYVLNSAMNLYKEIITQSLFARFIIADRLIEFGFCVGMK